MPDVKTALLAIRVEVDPARLQVWQASLVRSLRQRGHRVELTLRQGAGTWPTSLSLIIKLEGILRAGSRQKHFALLSPLDRAKLLEGAALESVDLTIDLTSALLPPSKGRWLKPAYDLHACEEAAAAAILENRRPSLAIYDSAGEKQPKVYRAAIETPTLLTASLDNLMARMRTLLIEAVEHIARGGRIAGAQILPLAHKGASAQAQKLTVWGQSFRLALNHLSRKPPYWYIGWRACDADRLTETMAIPGKGWQRIKDDGQRYFADPLLFTEKQLTHLFVEELPYVTGKGIISVMDLGPNGPGPARPVLEVGHHLSYPFVFRHEGEVWMIPESSSVGRIDLYRARRFPDDWVFEATLVDGVEASDTTFLEYGGRLWLFATVSGEGASSWDALHIWSAKTLMGPWQAHARNAVLVDSLGARPAGPFYWRGKELWRPAMDCTTGYGRGLALCRVDQLDDEAYVQSLHKVLHPSGDWPGIGLHTVHWDNGFEVVDGCEPRR